ncbi:MAG: hypothetical protein Q7T19_06975 [Caulobacter sp.]|nr:hypothetical protein [Caulobacter sp.]
MAHAVATIGTTDWATTVVTGRRSLTLKGGADKATPLAEIAA